MLANLFILVAVFVCFLASPAVAKSIEFAKNAGASVDGTIVGAKVNAFLTGRKN
jgi:hypothetical protein